MKKLSPQAKQDGFMVLLLILIMLLAIFWPKKSEAQCSGPVLDTIQGYNCNFTTLSPPVNSGDVVNYCFWFKPETPDINMSYMMVQSSSCGPNVYQYLKFKIFAPTCDTMFWQGNIYPLAINTFVQGLDTSRYYILCLGWKALCMQDAICARYNPSPLPVEMSWISAEIENKTVVLQWETKSEINNDFFQIQKADSFFKFVDVERVKGMGNTTYPVLYHYVDFSPYYGISYYRIIQQDYDGTRTMYDPVAVIYKSHVVIVQPFINYNIIGQRIK